MILGPPGTTSELVGTALGGAGLCVPDPRPPIPALWRRGSWDGLTTTLTLQPIFSFGRE